MPAVTVQEIFKAANLAQVRSSISAEPNGHLENDFASSTGIDMARADLTAAGKKS